MTLVKKGNSIRVKSGYWEGQEGFVVEVYEDYFMVELNLHGDTVEFFEADIDEGKIEVIGEMGNE